MLISSQAFAAAPIQSTDDASGIFGINAISSNYIIGDLDDHKDRSGNRIGNLINDQSADELSLQNKGRLNLLIGAYNHLYGKANVVTGYHNEAKTRELTVEYERWNGGEPLKEITKGYHYVYGYSNKTDGVGSYIFGRFNDVKGVHNTVSGFANTVELNDNSDYTSTMNNVVSGTHHKVKGKYNIVIGKQNEAKTADDKGVEKTIVLGYKAKAQHNNSMALGAESITTRENEVSFGRDKIDENNPSIKRILSNVADGTNDYDVTNKKQVDAGDAKTLETAKQFTTEQIALEATKREEGDTKTLANAKLFTAGKIVSEALKREAGDAKTLVDAKKYTNEKFNPLNTKVAGIETKITATDGKITQVEGKVTQIGDKVTDVETKVAGVDSKIVQAKNEVVSQITAEAVKREAGDAKTLDDAKQYTDNKFNPLNTKVAGIETKITATDGKITQVEGKVADVETKVAGVDSKIVQAKNEVVSQITEEAVKREVGDAKTLSDANQYTDLKLGTLQTQVHNFQSDFNELNGKLGKLDSKLERGLAAANALSGLVLPQVVGKASFSAAVGGYGSRNAVAIGVGYTPKANITLKSAIAVNAGKNNKISYQMGAGWVW
ncbi:Adhesin YadA precursor [Haemophilus influenzae]|uniref:YadA-like family protein n=1 Tax=Haemophilus influenzae TaxID=727 RepID=UPI000D4AF1CB|nr:YadA-like family protein [Haemophilus influenzae]PRM16319.1 Adhesin YadA precursor [Haemophilus influenzae]